tara:strand:+ start:772 stop:1068 length:297 start_codon:yes stop_codon:yes gene_type:complete
MLNFTTKKEYQGNNVAELINAGFELGSEFCTFKQAVEHYKLPSGTMLKGMKSCARLKKIVTKEIYNKLSGKKEKKKVPVFFSVFEKNHIENILMDNGL